MKIGAFAKAFDLNISTVRYYINNGLLVPLKKNEQYEFNKACFHDMEKILKYKRYHFSLEEIQLLFFLEKASRFQDEIVLEVCANILETKRRTLISEKEALDSAIDCLSDEIDMLPVSAPKNKPGLGIPFSFIPYLYCPHCQTPLKLDSASLSEGFLQKGDLLCDCGYNALIKDGLIICEDFEKDTPFKAFNNVDSVFSMTNEYSTNYRMLIAKTYLWMYNQLASRLEQPQCILTGPFTLNFLLEYIEKLGKSHTYIIADPSMKRITKMQQYLSGQPYNIIFIVGKLTDLPIKHRHVDIFIDDFSTTNCCFTYNDLSTSRLSPLLKKGACAVGIFVTYKKAPKSLQNFRKDHPDFNPEKMTLSSLKTAWSQQGLHVNETHRTGYTSTTEKHFPRNVLGEAMEVYGYIGEK